MTWCKYLLQILVQNKPARLDKDFILTANDKIIKKSKRIEKQFRDGVSVLALEFLIFCILADNGIPSP